MEITVIVPIHEYKDNDKEMLTKALNSVPKNTNILLACSNESYETIAKKYGNENIRVINFESKNFSTLINRAVENIETEWFSILEMDDEYTPIFDKTFEKYKSFYPETSVFMPLTDLYDYENKHFLGYGNEAVWASSFSNELGYVDNDCLQNFFDFYMTGSIFNKSDWTEIGGLKENIKLTFWYEFLLRMTYNNKKVYIIPRVMYNHNLNRDGSLIKEYGATMSEKESNFYINVAKTDYFFRKERDASKYTYVEEEVKEG